MNCEDYQILALEHLHGRLDDRQEAAFLDHIIECESCQTVLAQSLEMHLLMQTSPLEIQESHQQALETAMGKSSQGTDKKSGFWGDTFDKFREFVALPNEMMARVTNQSFSIPSAETASSSISPLTALLTAFIWPKDSSKPLVLPLVLVDREKGLAVGPILETPSIYVRPFVQQNNDDMFPSWVWHPHIVFPASLIAHSAQIGIGLYKIPGLLNHLPSLKLSQLPPAEATTIQANEIRILGFKNIQDDIPTLHEYFQIATGQEKLASEIPNNTPPFSVVYDPNTHTLLAMITQTEKGLGIVSSVHIHQFLRGYFKKQSAKLPIEMISVVELGDEYIECTQAEILEKGTGHTLTSEKGDKLEVYIPASSDYPVLVSSSGLPNIVWQFSVPKDQHRDMQGIANTFLGIVSLKQ